MRAKVGILGAGQLGRMLAIAGYPLDLGFVFVDPAPDAPAAALADQIALDYDNPTAQSALAGCDVVTYEFENVPVAAAEQLLRVVSVLPPPAALVVAQDRLLEKGCFRELGIPTPEFRGVGSESELESALRDLGLPAFVKTRRFGYDGRGQAVIERLDQAAACFKRLRGLPLIVERKVGFDRELSVIAVRGKTGEIRFYPLVENHHEHGILKSTLAPAPDLTPELTRKAEGYARRLLEHFDYVGVLALELFQVGSELVANEIAPRVHNSGHWTIEGAETSQFENHLRAVLGMPLGDTATRGHSAMLNLIGSLPDPAPLLELPGAHLHLYGKSERAGRKLGHLTLRRNSPEERAESLDAALKVLERAV